MTKGRMTTQPCEAHGCVNDADCAFREAMAGALSGMRESIESAMRRCMHLYWRLTRGLTLGVRGLVIDDDRRVFLVQHTYQWPHIAARSRRLLRHPGIPPERAAPAQQRDRGIPVLQSGRAARRHDRRHARAHRRGSARRTREREVVISSWKAWPAASRRQPSPIMRRGKIELRSERHDAAGIDLFVAAVIVLLDVIHVHGLGHARHLVEIAQIVR